MVALAGLVLALAPPVASAHLGHVILRAERYLKLDVSGHDARVVVSLTLGEAEGRRVLEAADVDRDGRVTEAERDRYLSEWAEGLAEELPVRVDGEPRTVVFRDGWLEPIGRVREAAVTVELVAHFELEGGEQWVRLEDRMVRREVYDRTDVAFRVRDGAELLASGAELEPADPVPDFAYGPELLEGEPVPLAARVRTAERPVTIPWAFAAGGLAALLAAAGALGWWRRRRATAEPPG